jgi:hypothetical protein
VVWWRPWTWHRVVGLTVTRESEYSSTDRALLEAHQALIADLGPHGIPMSEATNTANQFEFEAPESPRIDFAAKVLSDAQDAYYAKYPKAPRQAHIWRVKRRPSRRPPAS